MYEINQSITTEVGAKNANFSDMSAKGGRVDLLSAIIAKSLVLVHYKRQRSKSLNPKKNSSRSTLTFAPDVKLGVRRFSDMSVKSRCFLVFNP